MFVVVISCFVTDNWKLAIISCSGLSPLGECDKKYFAWNDNNSHHLCVVIILCFCLCPLFCDFCVYICYFCVYICSFVFLYNFMLRLVSTWECDKNYFAWNVVNNSHHLCGHYSVFMSVPIILRFVCLYLFICDHFFCVAFTFYFMLRLVFGVQQQVFCMEHCQQ